MRKSGKSMMEVEGHKIKDLVLYLVEGFFLCVFFPPLSFRLFTEETARSEIEKEHFLRSLRREKLAKSYF